MTSVLSRRPVSCLKDPYLSQDCLPAAAQIQVSANIIKAKKTLSKWRILFDDVNSQWISFKPQPGLYLYPCYSCRNMFSTKSSFLDHVNRRTNIIRFQCQPCNTAITFYNRCSFLFHTRKHYSLTEGRINLDDVDIAMLPTALAGWMPDPNIPQVFNVEEKYSDFRFYINAQFYSPNKKDFGSPVVTLKPNDLLFRHVEGNGTVTHLGIKQVCINIPKCQFVIVETQNGVLRPPQPHLSHALPQQTQQPPPAPAQIPVPRMPKLTAPPKTTSPPEDTTTSGQSTTTTTANSGTTSSEEGAADNVEVKKEPEEETEEYSLPIIAKIESLNAETVENFPKCSECDLVQYGSMAEHFLGNNVPFDASLSCKVCRYVAPTKCSLKAHDRIHGSVPPYVCPECGKDFDQPEDLRDHLETVCFHLAKQVRFRCPGRRCGKIFAVAATYAAHFELHMDLYSNCNLCGMPINTPQEDAEEHKKLHDKPFQTIQSYACQVCGKQPQVGNYREHVREHTSDRSRCLYIYMCRFCKSYFRSTGTFAQHLLKCAKSKANESGSAGGRKDNGEMKFMTCRTCLCKVLTVDSGGYKECLRCRLTSSSQINNIPVAPKKVDTGTSQTYSLCILCNKLVLSKEREAHEKVCPYIRPYVRLIRTSDEQMVPTRKRSMMSTSSSDLDSTLDSSTEHRSPYKRRRKGFTIKVRGKRSLTGRGSEPRDVQAEKPTPFDGTYHCKVCQEYSSTDRADFHEHAVTHRHISTSFQCMECGECFVVKPSLAKHLRHFHGVLNVDQYFEENDCYDKKAVKDLEDSLKFGSLHGITKKSKDNEKPEWAKKDIRDYTDADMERLLDQWEEDEEPLEEDELPEHLRPMPNIDMSQLDPNNPEKMIAMTKKGRTLMTFVQVSGNPTREETEEITKLWQTSLWNNHIQIERYLVDDNRAIFLFKDGSLAPVAKDYLVEQERCESITIENQVFPGKHSKAAKEEL